MHSLMPAEFPLALVAYSPLPVTAERPIRVDAGFEFTGQRLRLRYRLRGPLGEIRLDHPPASLPTERLWEHSCFEAFVAAGPSHYREFNFASNGQWAAFDFSDYRRRAASAVIADEVPRVEARREGNDFILVVEVPDALLPAVEGERELGLSVVLERVDASLDYFALAHCSDRPDSHDRRSWRCRLPQEARA